MIFNLPDNIRQHILKHALATPDLEVCGLLAGRGSKIISAYKIENIDKEPSRNFFMQPEGQIAALKTMRQTNQQLCAIYHSHPHSEAIPSKNDLENAAYQGTVYLIISLMKKNPDIRAYYFNGKEFQTIMLAII